jgi:hypothetical protein
MYYTKYFGVKKNFLHFWVHRDHILAVTLIRGVQVAHIMRKIPFKPPSGFVFRKCVVACVV